MKTMLIYWNQYKTLLFVYFVLNAITYQGLKSQLTITYIFEEETAGEITIAKIDSSYSDTIYFEKFSDSIITVSLNLNKHELRRGIILSYVISDYHGNMKSSTWDQDLLFNYYSTGKVKTYYGQQ